jgi:AcrR family transcriptional regulator
VGATSPDKRKLSERTSRTTVRRDKLDELVEAAGELFEEHGYRGVTVDEILKAVDFSKGGMYHRVRNKAELLYLAVQGAWDAMRSDVIEPVSEIDDPEAQLRELTRRHLELLTLHYKGGISITSAHARFLEPEKRDQIIETEKRYIQFVAGIFKRLARSRRRRKVNTTVAALNHLGMILHAVRWYRPHRGLTPAQIADGIVDTMLHGFTGDGSPG